MIVATICTLCVLSGLMWLMEALFKVIGWTIGAVVSIILVPVGIVCFLVCGIASVAEYLLPLMLVVFVLSLIVPDRS